MKRIQLFEFEDFPWFPSFLRDDLMRMLKVVHRMLGTADVLADLITGALERSGRTKIIDLCSGAGGPLPDAIRAIRQQGRPVELLLTDLYPNRSTADEWNNQPDEGIRYQVEPVDATTLAGHDDALRTMICSFHHMPPERAKAILSQAMRSRAPILIFEISDNSFPPRPLWWIGLPMNIVFAVIVSLMVRPMTLRRLFFTFVVPVLPLTFAWDGAVSNARTYTPSDLDELLRDLKDDGYHWERGVIAGKPTAKLYLMGMPTDRPSGTHP